MPGIGKHLVNHVGIVLDESTSMSHLSDAVVRVTDELIRGLAEDSQKFDQETRLSIWGFSDKVRNIVWDIDVLRLPSVRDLYGIKAPYTSLISATLLSVEDMRDIPQKYDDHAFLLYVITDGQENNSYNVNRRHNPGLLTATLNSLADNWTVGIMVPDLVGVRHATNYGFARGNIDRWDTTERGVEEAGDRMRAATQTYMASRAGGQRSTRSLFVDTSAAAVNRDTVKATMRPADPASYVLHFIPPVTHPFPKALSRRVKYRLDEYIRGTLGLPFVLGRNYYELIKSEEVQPQKDIAVVDRKTDEVFIGREARDLIGLPANATTRVKPDFNDEYRIFVRSDSTNRNMLEGQRLLILR